jgi:hypothetical protein
MDPFLNRYEATDENWGKAEKTGQITFIWHNPHNTIVRNFHRRLWVNTW